VRKSELARLVKLIYSEGETSRVDLAEETNLAPSYVSSLVQRLLQKKWILEGNHVPSGRGRRKVLLHINPDLAHVMGLEIGRVHSRIVVTDFLGKVLSFKKLCSEVSCGEEHALKCIHREIKECLKRDHRIQGMGVAHSGVIDRASGTVLFWPKVSGWRNVQLKRVLEEEYGLITVVEDSARTTAIAEQRFGHGKGQRNFVFVHAGVGIGAAIFVDGHLYTGQDGMAGELGHTTIDEAGPLCSCGNRGCLEVYASGSSIIDKIHKALEQGVTSSLAGLAPNHHQDVSLEAIASAAASHDRLCETVLSEAGTHLGTALASIVNLLNPARIVLGGTLPRVTKTSLLEPLQRSLRDRAFQRSVSQVELVVSELGEDAAAVGACLLAANRILETLSTLESSNKKLPHAESLFVTMEEQVGIERKN
jgi:predicted NBD/HSP70 family sugar kinase